LVVLQTTQARNTKLADALKESEQKVEQQQQRVDQAEEAATWCEAAMCELEAKWAEGEANEQIQADQQREKERKLGEQLRFDEQQGENKENTFASLLVA
jgi:septal ring factor EnvC (AmiA/AmiB activator)